MSRPVVSLNDTTHLPEPVIIFGQQADGTVTKLLVDAEGRLVSTADFSGADISISDVSIIASALPTGAATAAKQDTGNGSLATIAETVADAATEATLAGLDAKVTACNTGAVVIASGAVTATLAAPTRSNSTALEAAHVVKTGAGRVLDVVAHNNGPGQYLHLYEATSAPGNGTVPFAIFAMPAQASVSLSFGHGMPFATGLVVGNSTTIATRTAGGSDCFFTASYL